MYVFLVGQHSPRKMVHIAPIGVTSNQSHPTKKQGVKSHKSIH